MESQPQNPEFRNNLENFHPMYYTSEMTGNQLNIMQTMIKYPVCAYRSCHWIK